MLSRDAEPWTSHFLCIVCGCDREEDILAEVLKRETPTLKSEIPYGKPRGTVNTGTVRA